MKKTFAIALAAASLAALSSSAFAQSTRDQIRIVGSSTVYPFSTVVAENFGKMGKFKAPVVESVGTGGGFKLFCAGVGPQHPDIANASRPVTDSEREACKANGITSFTEVTFGYDGITLARQAQQAPMAVTEKQLWLALAKQVPVNGKLVDNPYNNWSDVDPSLPKTPILVFGPAPNHGTRDAFVELVMDSVGATIPEIKALPKDQQKAAIETVRDDGSWVDVSEDYALIVGKLASNPDAVGLFTFSYLDQNPDKIRGLTVDGVMPTFDNIASKKYPLSRPLFFYVKDQHVKVVPGIREYVTEFLSDKAAGADGYLVSKGLIPLTKDELTKQRAAAEKAGL
ncbi:MAG: PstS family phosphate ABC transporter substrate-binding protein [Azospirillaceae bacterium]|nr:PstS family phosphate ABC transporter substrate-binding protein [Azospirillaceae bacterium]